MLLCRTLLLGARPALSPDSTSTHPAPRADPRDALDAMRHDHGRPGDRPRETAGGRNGRHSHRIHRNIERSKEPAFSNSPQPPPDVVTKGDSRRRTQGPRPCRRSTASTAPGIRGSSSAAHPRRPHRAEPLHDAAPPPVITRRGAGASAGDAGSSVKRLSHGLGPQAVRHRQKGCPAGSR